MKKGEVFYGNNRSSTLIALFPYRYNDSKWLMAYIDPTRGVMDCNEHYIGGLIETAFPSWHVTKPQERSDNFTHVGLVSPDGKLAYVFAGCRAFTVEQAKVWWTARRRSAVDRKHDRDLNRWSLRYVAQVEALRKQVQAKHRQRQKREIIAARRRFAR